MSAKNGDKARHQKQRKRKLLQRVRIRTMVTDAKNSAATGRAGIK
jgi:hypothetical protein